MKIALAQLNYHIGNFAENNKKIKDQIQRAKTEGANLIVFAELAVSGYPAKDLLRNQRFLDLCDESLKEIATLCQGISCIIGAPVRNTDPEGKPLYNAAILLEDGVIKLICKKSLLPDYDVFDEYRYFEPNSNVSCIDIQGTKVALTICEDLWDDETSNNYVGDLMGELRKENPSVIVNIAASPFSYIHFENRLNVLRRNVIKAGCPLVYVNQVGAHTDIVFDGRSLAFDRKGEILAELKGFEEDFRIVDIFALADAHTHTADSEIALIHQALILGIRDYFQKSGFTKAVLGLSGGLDSAIVAALACEALGADNVLAVLMPSIYSSDHSLKDALDLVNNTGCAHRIVPIKDIASSFEETLSETFSGREPDLTEENIQARIRGTILMAVSNKFGHILLNTSNKSEAAVGYGTLYGDMAGSLSVIGDVYKTQAYALAKHINREREIIPLNTIVKPPSAELRPDQKDSDALPEYDMLDSILFQLIELEKSGSEVVQSGFDETLVTRIAKLLHNAEFKRFQAPPILRVSQKAFGSGRAMPLVAKYIF
ncbi:NAD+ synthase [Sphingobacterium paludis]|uniref:Glutamine-dependent NAD(+) synthetase n=1 Tax=Sphingobacterium paludis TaxID=1476465 RepID=A0A4V3E235_9SPHI|nr:NAD+ synthase [Sphingobacterium paludis]TDS15718.1 NH(3)-dependent NAD(+) synthetase [Sphingobacterium paludis]